MPELPEVETIRQGLLPRLVGARLLTVRVQDPAAVLGGGPAHLEGLLGLQVADVARQGKYLWVRGRGCRGLLFHLRMTGRLLWQEHEAPGERTRVLLGFDRGFLRYDDVRRLGGVWPTLTRRDLPPGFRNLGLEPLSGAFTPERLARLLHGRRAAVKCVLLDQRRVAGLGNIYVDESLFLAGVHPARPAGELSREEIEALWRAVRAVLEEALAAGGTSFSQYVNADGRPGSFGARLRVYGRRGEPCPRCGGPVHRTVLCGRGTHFCPRCQT